MIYNLIMWMAVLTALFLCAMYLVKVKRGYPSPLLKLIGRIVINTREKRVQAVMDKYRESATKIRPSQYVLPLVFVALFAYILLTHTVFFAVVYSGSMEPAFSRGDLVFMQNIHVKPEVGDIIMFETAGRRLSVTHRVHSVEGDGFRTKGDATPVDMWIVRPEQIQGVAVPIGGHPIVLEDVGNYFIEDYRDVRPGMYGREYGFVSMMLRTVQTSGLMIFIIMIALYISLSIGELHRRRA